MSKIKLTKDAPRISLTKAGERQGVMRVNLNWNANPYGGAIDLDLGCLYELSTGQKGVVQALGNSFGSENQPPYISLDGDDRSGSSSGGENMRINLEVPERFRRILIFAMIYEGAPNWAAVDGVVTMFPTSGPQIEVRMDSPNNEARICAIAQVYYAQGALHVNREVQYINGSQRILDQAYSWGLRWTAGRKD
ncbi:Tellurium resistance [Mycobacterium asiaticum]|uniref:Tellurium resistance n=1 Tax=Mycobacterium asiaticum TaxID=1790 RepID=A0A1A3P1B6_MYCAS|nr:Tellurium resistance [Mycobacterium asiaticum]